MQSSLDLSPVFNELLKKHDAGPIAQHKFDPARTDGFLKEAYRINGHIATLSQQLSDVRQAYLSTAPPRRSALHRRTSSSVDQQAVTALTDAQREEIDGNAKRLLRDLNASIRGLTDAEALHQETQQALVRKQYAGPSLRLPFGSGPSLSLLPKSAEQSAAEEGLKQAAAHRESVLWYLRQRLQACGHQQQTMMEARLARMMKETTAAPVVLPSMPGGIEPTAVSGLSRKASGRTPGQTAFTGKTGASAVAALEEEQQRRGATFAHAGEALGDGAGPEEGLSEQQVQMFERGNQAMLQYYETTLDKVRAAEQSLIEISELQTMLVNNLEVQSTHVEQMVTDADNTEDNVARGNRELQKALDRPSTARYTFYAAGGLCLFVVVWDFFI